MAGHHHSFVPAAGHDWLLPFYDPLLRLLGADSARDQLLEQAGLAPGMRVLDIGCGTGTLLVQTLRAHPDALIVGLDPDPKALARARAKLERAGLEARLDQGFANELPYEDASFDRVLSSFMLHHLEGEVKAAALREARRVLRPGGSVHVLDFGGSGERRDGLLARLLHSGESVQENYAGRIPQQLADAGFAGAREVAHRRTVFGGAGFYAASAPE